MTMDDACQYVRALATSEHRSGTYDAGAQTCTNGVDVGSTDVPTYFPFTRRVATRSTRRAVAYPRSRGRPRSIAVGRPGGDVTPPQISGVAAGR